MPCSAEEPLGVVHRLLKGALGFGTGVCDRQVYAHALCGLLREVISGSDRAAAAAHGFLWSSLAGPRLAQLPADLLSNILNSVASSLRCVCSSCHRVKCNLTTRS